MSKIKIVTDSSVQLSEQEIKDLEITVVPLTITIDGKSYVDGVELTRTEFVKMMHESAELPKTSQPAPGNFIEVFDRLSADGSQVLGIFLSHNLSGTVDTARQASAMCEHPELIKVLDSQLTDRDQAFQVLAAARMAKEGKSMEEIEDKLAQIKSSQKLYMMVVTLDNLIKGGRLGKLTGKIANFLNVRLHLTMQEGHIEIVKKGRGKKFTKSFDDEVLAEIEANKGHIKELGISYVDTPEVAEALKERILAIDPQIDIYVAETSPVIMTHAGSGAYAILFYTE
ncbi:MAG: DegV family protein [Lactobacillus sp.]|nr:DegV family protein [Lactobacillus sp.]